MPHRQTTYLQLLLAASGARHDITTTVGDKAAVKMQARAFADHHVVGPSTIISKFDTHDS
jgi:hypothetical protein